MSVKSPKFLEQLVECDDFHILASIAKQFKAALLIVI